MSPRVRALSALLLAYAVTFLAGYAALIYSPWDNPVWAVAFADAVATVVIFGFSFAHKNSSFYDPYWSVTPLLMGLIWLFHFGHADADNTRALIMLALIGVWGARLTANFLRGFSHIAHCDWRYVQLQENNPRTFWLISFSGIHIFPSLLVFLGLLPVCKALCEPTQSLGTLDIIATLLTAGAIALEATADRQLHQFAATNTDPQRCVDVGLWAWSRHPNYMGEIGFWWGLGLFGVAASGDYLWSLTGALTMNAMFVFISIPMMEKRMLRRRPGYEAVIRNVPMLLPRPPKRQGLD